MKIFTKVEAFKEIIEDGGLYIAHIHCDNGYCNLYVGEQPTMIRSKHNSIPIGNWITINNLIHFLQGMSDVSHIRSDYGAETTLRKTVKEDGSLYIETNGCLEKKHDSDLPFGVRITQYELPFIIILLESVSKKIEDFSKRKEN